MGKPVHIFSIRSKCEEMVNMAAIAVIDAKKTEEKKNRQIVLKALPIHRSAF
jgi:hypothetical protein